MLQFYGIANKTLYIFKVFCVWFLLLQCQFDFTVVSDTFPVRVTDDDHLPWLRFSWSFSLPPHTHAETDQDRLLLYTLRFIIHDYDAKFTRRNTLMTVM